MKVLLVHQLIRLSETEVTYGAVDHYRMQSPFDVLQRQFGINFSTIDSLNVPDETLLPFDLILFSRTIRPEYVDRLNKLGIVFGVDIDDYWFLPEEHILYQSYKELNTTELIINSINAAHFVTCTTEILADKIRPLNPNVYVIENGIDTEYPYWNTNKNKSTRLRFGFTGGTTHADDLQLIAQDVARSISDNKFFHKAQFGLCFKAEWSRNGQVPSMYIAYERMLTEDHKCFEKYLPEYSMQLKLLLEPDGTDKPYRQLKFRRVEEFPLVYDDLDIIVAPLQDNEFNRCKSNIKMLEAGFKDCGIIVSDIPPYSPLATKKNSFLLSEKNFFEWQRYILNNPNALEDRKAQLRQDVQKYSLQTLSKKRLEIYESCVGVLK